MDLTDAQWAVVLTHETEWQIIGRACHDLVAEVDAFVDDRLRTVVVLMREQDDIELIEVPSQVL